MNRLPARFDSIAMNDGIQKARDEWIALRCQHGEPEAFAILVSDLEKPLLYFAQKLLKDEDRALDVLQDVWLTAFRTIRRLENPKLVRAWLYRLVRGRAIDRLRKDEAVHRHERAYAEVRATVDPEPTFDNEDAAAVHRALDALSFDQREALVLHFLERMTMTEIATVLDCPEGTVKSRIHSAKKALKAILRGEADGKRL